MLRLLVTFYVGFIIMLIAAGMMISGMKGLHPQVIDSLDAVHQQAFLRNYQRDPQSSQVVIELQGPVIRDLFENNHFTEFPD